MAKRSAKEKQEVNSFLSHISKEFIAQQISSFVLRVEDIENYYGLKEKNIEIKELCKVLKEDIGFSGQYRKNGNVRFEFPHLSKLSHKEIKCCKPTYGLVNAQNDLDEYKDSPVFSTMPTFEKKKGYKYKSDKYVFVFYDVEALKDDSFVGLLLEGYEYTTIPINKALGIFKGISKKVYESNRKPIFIAFNDVYDGNMVVRCAVENLTIKKARENSNFIIKMLKAMKLSTIKDLSMFGKIESDVKYNPLSNYVPTYDAMLSFGVAENSQSAVGLKHVCMKRGMRWDSFIGGDIFKYCQADVENLARLFLDFGGIDDIESLEEMQSLAGIESNIYSKTFICSCLIKKMFPSGLLVPDFLKVEKRKEYIDQIKDKNGIVEYSEYKGSSKTILKLKNNRLNVELRGGVGGVHSKTSPVFSKSDDEYTILDVDIVSFYPSIMCNDTTRFILDDVKTQINALRKIRVEQKKLKNIARSNALKIFINTIFGMLNKYDSANDPLPTTLVTSIAKIIICKLLVIIEWAGGIIIDANTDGVIFKIKREKTETLFDKLNSFCSKTGYEYEKTEIDYIAYAASGNYLYKDNEGNYKTKGQFVSTGAYSGKIKGVAYNIFNMQEILVAYIEQGKGVKPIINSKFGDGESKEFQIVEELPFTINFDSYIKGSQLGSTNFLNDEPTIVDEELGLKLAKNKLDNIMNK